MSNNFLNRPQYNLGWFAKKIKSRNQRRKFISLKPDKPEQGNVLISYIVEPFLLEPGQPVPTSHTNYWECLQMAKTFLELGYCVDVVGFCNDAFIPRKHYTFFIEVRWTLQRVAGLLNEDCIKIVHIDAAHLLFHNAAECNRLLALQQRRGVTLKPRRFEMPNLALEHADCATVLGNEFTMNTYRYAKKPLYRVPLSTSVVYPWPEEKDFEACRKRFLWFGSGGLVHKGLDLVLEAFSEMPDYDLIVCGPVQKEKDFEKAFYKELYQTSNITTIGWVDISSAKFVNILNSCVGIVYPSCSEGGGGCVITCMHAGLIPIVTYEASVDVKEEYGVVLKESSIEEIKNSIQMVSSLPASELKMMSRLAWEFVRKNHTREKFAEEYRNTIDKITNTHCNTYNSLVPRTSNDFLLS